MADRPYSPGPDGDAGGDDGTSPEQSRATGMPRWVKIFGIIALVLVLLFVILHLTGRGFRGHTPPSSIIEHGMRQS